MQYKQPSRRLQSSELTSGQLRWQSPSNIALVKYWGKFGRQLPSNPSVSLTLEAAHTDTTMAYRPGRGGVELLLDGDPQPDFARRTQKYFTSLAEELPWIAQFDFTVRTHNSFPHSAGIASSASGMSALALCLVDLERQLTKSPSDDTVFFRRASHLARLGSGSAGRSVYGGAAVWGKTSGLSQSDDEYAIPFSEELHPIFRGFHDAILLISRSEKSVSSSAGHGLMEDNPYAPARFTQARQRLNHLLPALRAGDLETVGEITEAEALTLHALMMASAPPYLLLEPNTLTAIRRVQTWRKETGHPLYFTLDAGPNLHLLYPDIIAEAAKTFIRSELLPLCQEGRYIADRVGPGPVRVSMLE
ncbi:MAG: diphosphomevalonate decarboxylase [Saprospiraceae bacterium]